MFNWWKNLLNSERKQGEKTGGSIDEKPPNSIKKQRKKPILYIALQEVKNL